MNENACCFTGHRPSKLPFDDETCEAVRLLKENLKWSVAAMIKKGVDMFYTGMAMGVDIWCAEALLELKQENTVSAGLFAVVPFAGQADRWPVEWKKRYFSVLDAADDAKVLNDRYISGCMHERNRYIVDNSAHMIAVFSGESGGTEYTVRRAKKKELEIFLIDPLYPNDIHIINGR